MPSEKKSKASKENAAKARAKLAVLLKRAKKVQQEEMEEEVKKEMQKDLAKEKADVSTLNDTDTNPVLEADIESDDDVSLTESSSSSEHSDDTADTADTDTTTEASKSSKSKRKSSRVVQKKLTAKEKRNPEMLIKSIIEDEFKKLNGNLSRTVASHQTNLARARVQQFLRTN